MKDFYYHNIILKSLNNPKTTNLDSFVKNCNGCFIVDCINELRYINSNKAKAFYKEKSLKRNLNFEKYYKDINYLPIPHMLDSDWRFTKKSANFLFSIIGCERFANDKCLMVGTPSLLHNKDKSNLQNLNIMLVEKNKTSVKHHNKIIKDILKFKTKTKYNCIICDPPWYHDTIIKFVKNFNKLIQVEGTLILILPPIGVRSSISKEHENLMQILDKLGFELQKTYLQSVTYTSSPFEVNSILENNIYNFSLDWRTGDVYVFKKKRKTKYIIKLPKFIYKKSIAWQEFQLKNIRIKVRRKKNIYKKLPVISHVCKNDILESVSMRNPILEKVDIWTSGNRVFECNNTRLVCRILKSLQNKSIEECYKIYPDQANLLSLFEEIINKEYEEYGKYWDKTI